MTKDEALTMCLEYIETNKHERKYVRHAIKAALEQAEPPPEWEAINNIIAEYGLQAIDFVADWKAAQPVQEPVAWRYHPVSPFADKEGMHKVSDAWQLIDKPDHRDAHSAMCGMEAEPLYTAPPPRPWVGLTEDEKFEMAAMQYGWEDLLIAAEAKLKEKNT